MISLKRRQMLPIGLDLGVRSMALVQLEQAGTTLFVRSRVHEVDPECRVVHGALEQSNTGIFEEMVGIMTTLRNYEACQKMLRAVDQSHAQMMNKLG